MITVSSSLTPIAQKAIEECGLDLFGPPSKHKPRSGERGFLIATYRNSDQMWANPEFLALEYLAYERSCGQGSWFRTSGGLLQAVLRGCGYSSLGSGVLRGMDHDFEVLFRFAVQQRVRPAETHELLAAVIAGG